MKEENPRSNLKCRTRRIVYIPMRTHIASSFLKIAAQSQPKVNAPGRTSGRSVANNYLLGVSLAREIRSQIARERCAASTGGMKYCQ